MHPNGYLRTFWRMELRPVVFVAMSFAPAYADRFRRVIEPAISRLMIDGAPMSAQRVDLSKRGDSILTEIVDGIAHSRLVLADVSSVGKDSVTGDGYRNGNVMYEVGVALACRQPQDVLLVRDDHDRFLFDVSTIPHMTIDFTSATAETELHDALVARLAEQDLAGDARVQLALSGLSNQELTLLQQLGTTPDTRRWWEITGTVLSVYEAGLCRLLDKGLIKVAGRSPSGHPAYVLTTLGKVAARQSSVS